MGNVDSRSQFHGGHMMLATQQPFYSPGQQIAGTIYLRTINPVNAKAIEIEVIGKEKASLVSREAHHTTDAQGNPHTEWHDKKHKSKRNIFHSKVPAVLFPGGVAPGDYAIPFGFMLPLGLPSSFFFKRGNSQ